MKLFGHASCKATDPVRFAHREPTATVLSIGPDLDLFADLHIRGTATERVAFLHRLATEATEAAYRLAVETERAEVGA